MAACGKCGFDVLGLPLDRIADALRGVIPRFQHHLASASASDERLGRRPDATIWSALEYACHVRDVMLIQRDRVLRALVEEVPTFPPMYREERVALARYASDPPPLVAQELAFAAGLLARLFDGLSAEQLARGCVYGAVQQAEVDLGWVGRHTVHEAEHHLYDIDRVLLALP